MVHVGDGADGCLEHSLETENLLFKQDGVGNDDLGFKIMESWEKSGSSFSAVLIRTVIFPSFFFHQGSKGNGRPILKVPVPAGSSLFHLWTQWTLDDYGNMAFAFGQLGEVPGRQNPDLDMMPLGEWLKMNQHDIKIYKDDMK